MNERRRFFYKKSFNQYSYEYLGITNKMSNSRFNSTEKIIVFFN